MRLLSANICDNLGQFLRCIYRNAEMWLTMSYQFIACRRNAPPGLRDVPRASCRITRHLASIRYAFAPAALRLRPADYPRRAMLGAPQCCRTGCAGSAPSAPRRSGQGAGCRQTRWHLLRQVVQLRAVLNAGVYCLSYYEGGFTDIPHGIAMVLPRHASIPAPQGTAGAFSLVVGRLTWPASVDEPVHHSCGYAESAPSPFGAVRPKASLFRCETWRGRSCAPDFMAATVRRKQFPPPLRGFLAQQILFASRLSATFRSQAVQPACPPPAGSQQGRDGREPCSTRKEKHHG